jgi:ribosomal protein L7/L12
MNWMQKFWNNIFPHHLNKVSGDFADVVIVSTGKNITYLNHVLTTMTGLSSSEIKFYTEKVPVKVFSGLPRESALSVAQSLEITGATVELRFNNKV